MLRFTAAPLFMVIGFLLMRYPVRVANFTGPIGFAERYFRTLGGTYAWWRFVGFGILMLGLLWLTGVVSYRQEADIRLPGTSGIQ